MIFVKQSSAALTTARLAGSGGLGYGAGLATGLVHPGDPEHRVFSGQSQGIGAGLGAVAGGMSGYRLADYASQGGKSRATVLALKVILPLILGSTGATIGATAGHSLAAGRQDVRTLWERMFHKTSADKGWLGLPMPKPVVKKLKAIHKHIDKADLGPDGLDKDPHVTLAYGIAADKNPMAVRGVVSRQPEAQVTLGAMTAFHNDDATVLKFDVKSEDLQDIHKTVKDKIGMPGSTHPVYKPHVTVAYLKPGTDISKYKHLESKLKGRTFKLKAVDYNNGDTHVDIQLKAASSGCEVCGAQIIGRCRCASQVVHDKQALAKGHGCLCKNGHRVGHSGLWVWDKEAVARHEKFKADFGKQAQAAEFVSAGEHGISGLAAVDDVVMSVINKVRAMRQRKDDNEEQLNEPAIQAQQLPVKLGSVHVKAVDSATYFSDTAINALKHKLQERKARKDKPQPAAIHIKLADVINTALTNL